MSRWTIRLTCALCATAIVRSGQDTDELTAECEQEAREGEWLELPERDLPRRSAGWMCRECTCDVMRLAT